MERMITKQQFVDIIEELRKKNDFVEETNKKAKELNDSIISNFFNAMSLSISFENTVLQLLEILFDDTDIISWWLYECDYGRSFKLGYIQETVGDRTVNIDLTSPEKLYDYLIKQMEE